VPVASSRVGRRRYAAEVIFSRRKDQSRNCATAIAKFWKWWPSVRAEVEKSISGGLDEKFVRQITKKVAAIHPDLQWEFSKGTSSQHVLVVCAGGDATLRAIAERWRAAAPQSDPTWTYHASRQADPEAFGSTLTIDGRTVVLQKMRFGIEVDADRHQIDVTAFHPIFSVMTQKEQLRVTFVALDRALGENGVELWVGQVTSSRTEPQRPHTATQLRSAVTNLAQKASDAAWTIVGDEDEQGNAVLAAVQVPLKPVRWPRFDTHLRLDVPYRDRQDNGFPAGDSLDALRAFEDRLVAAIATDGELVAHETTQGRRTFHLYVDGPTRATDAVKRLLPQWRESNPTLAASFDPAWHAVSHLRT
jgi:hypothetical protein